MTDDRPRIVPSGRAPRRILTIRQAQDEARGTSIEELIAQEAERRERELNDRRTQ